MEEVWSTIHNTVQAHCQLKTCEHWWLSSAHQTTVSHSLCSTSCFGLHCTPRLKSLMRSPGCNTPLIWFLILALYIYIVCLFISYAFGLILFSSLFPPFFIPFSSCLLPYLSFPLRIYSLHFQTGYRKRWLNLALVFLCLVCVVIHFFWLVNACFCCVRLSFFHIPSRDWLGETSPKWPILCKVGHKTTTQSINQPPLKNNAQQVIVAPYFDFSWQCRIPYVAPIYLGCW